MTPRHRNHPDFPLRRFVLCHCCGRPLTGSWSRGRRGGRYAYYRCPSSGSGSVNVRREQLETLFVEVLEGLKPRPEVLKLFHEVTLTSGSSVSRTPRSSACWPSEGWMKLKHRRSRLVEVSFTKPPTSASFVPKLRRKGRASPPALEARPHPLSELCCWTTQLLQIRIGHGGSGRSRGLEQRSPRGTVQKSYSQTSSCSLHVQAIRRTAYFSTSLNAKALTK